MSMRLTALAALTTATLLASPFAALATNGYFEIGYGIKAKGMGGAGVAFPQDSIATATNPAGMAFVRSRADLNVDLFRPDRDASLMGMDLEGNETANFFCPEAGFVYQASDRLALGLAMYGNGGMNTDYDTPIPGFGTSNAGINLEQMFVAPTLAYKLTPHHALGIAPIFAYQRFRASGLQSFGITEDGNDNSIGGGIRVGYTGQIYDWLTVGATYQSPIWMTHFAKYSNLFADDGKFDIPANFAFGVAVKPVQTVTVACDVEEILYNQVSSIGHDLTMQRLMAGLGSQDGPGFGWQNVTVLKIGAAWDVLPNLTLRAGYNWNSQPIPNDQTLFNMLAPGVVQHHVTAGVSWKVNEHIELNGYYMHAFKQEVVGAGNLNGADATLSMHEDSFGLGLGWIF